jgi:hypothetical protein
MWSAYVAPQIKALLELQRVTGMRSGEVCRMRGADLNTMGSVWTYPRLGIKTCTGDASALCTCDHWLARSRSPPPT